MIRAHVLRNALLPVITFAGIQLGQMAGGAVLTETVFAWPGIGRLMFDALLQRDYQLLLGIFLVTSIMVVVFNLLTDVLYRLIDPRIGAGAQQSRRMKSFARRYMRNHGAVAGLVIVLLVVAVALAAPLLYEESPWMMVADPLIPPFTNADYPFGTDMLGRDITAGLVWGARVSLLVGLLSTAVALGFGIVVGAIAGYCGGRIDDALMRFTEFFQTIPQLAMAVVLVAIIGPSVYSIMGAIALVSWPPAARLVRSEFMTLKQREFVQAAIVIGQAPARIVGTQILPNRHVAHHRVGLVHGGNRHSHGVLAVLPGAGRPQRDELGLHDRRGPHHDPRSLVDERVAGRGHPSDRAGHQPDRRRPERCPQPAAAQRAANKASHETPRHAGRRAGHGRRRPLLSIRNLSIALPAGGDRAYAVRDVSYDIRAGEILCIVGESGSGKSMSANAIMGLLPDYLTPQQGSILFRGADLLRQDEASLQAMRGKDMAMIFQEPLSALNPLMTVGEQISEVMRVHDAYPGPARLARAGTAGLRRPARSGHAVPRLSVPPVRRPAPARDDRHGAGAGIQRC